MANLVSLIICSTAVAQASTVLNAGSPVRVEPVVIDNPLANNMGHGTLVGLWFLNAEMLVNPEYQRWADWYANLDPQPPILVLDGNLLTLPQPV